MKQLSSPGLIPRSNLQGRLLIFAGAALFFYSVVLTLSPAVRLRSWQVEYLWLHWIGFAVWAGGVTLVHRRVRRLLPEADPYLLPAAALLAGWGLLTIWRLDTTLGFRQTLWLALSLLAFSQVINRPRLVNLLRRYKNLWLVGSLGLTALTFIFGTYPGGSGPRLWLGCCGVFLQPSEPLKLMMVAYLAAYLADRLPVNIGLVNLVLPSLVVTGAAFGILAAQRDLGTATLFIVLYAAILYQAIGKRRILVLSAVLIIIAGIISYEYFDVIRIRVDAWLNPWLDPSGRSYQIVQSLIAVAAGGLGGSGVGLGSPSVVPVAASDFIYTAIAEETGLMGSVVLLLLIALLTVRGLNAAIRAASLYKRYLAAGIVIYLAFQSILIIGGTLRLFPLTGVTLPFVSYGGSSLLTAFLCLAFLLLTSLESDDRPAPLLPTRPLLTIGKGLLAGLLLLALFSGYWAVIRGDELTAREDNPRWVIGDQFSRRGTLLDRNNQVISQTVGQVGSYTRELLYPQLGTLIGYSSLIYGKAGLEAALDSYLRGTSGNPSSTVEYNHIFFNQTPEGVDVRLSLDLRMQTKADELMQGQMGALVLLNAQSGEVLAMASQPTYNPNLLEEKWAEWMQDPRGVFLNRAAQGQYPLGGAIGPFLLEEVLETGILPPPNFNFYTSFNNQTWLCAIDAPSTAGWGLAIASGCPGARIELGKSLRLEQLVTLYQRLGFTESPALDLPVSQASSLPRNLDPTTLVLGQSELSVSPLQLALAAAMISGSGTRPTPRIATAIQMPQQGWVTLSGSPRPASSLIRSTAEAAAHQMHTGSLPVWHSVAAAKSGEKEVYWYVGGTLPGWQGTPLALAILLEESTASKTLEVGNMLMQAILLP